MTSTIQVSTTMELAAGAAAIGFAGIAVFQLGLALGAPLGRAAWSGTIPGRLPARLRVGSLVAGLIWSVAVLVVLGRVGVGPLPSIAWLIWALFGLLLLATVMNLASSSPWERYFWSPYAFVLAILTLVAARG
jgi:hypothetical protein